jgi:hypothetical protein
MDRFSLLDALTDVALVNGLKVSRERERYALADVLAHVAKVEERKLHVPAGYGSMLDYCVHELHYSKDAAYKRIHAARAALEFPVILDLVAEGALGLRVVNLLRPSLAPENADELLAAAAFKTQEEVRQLLAERFPQGAVETTIEPIGQPLTLEPASAEGAEPAPEADELVRRPVQGVVNPPQCMPLAADLYKLQLTMTGAMYRKLRRALDLFGRRKPVPDEAEILELGLDLLVERLEKKKLHATDKPGPRRPCAEDHIPAEVRRTVWERDRGRCTFTSEAGVRCPSCTDLEIDHVIPRARGGRSDDPGNLRLRCRAHNQYEAERTFGKAFMEAKREQARAAAAKRKAEREARREQARATAAERRKAERAAARAAAEAAEKAAREAREHEDFLWWMERLGCSAEDSEFAAAHCPRRPGQFAETHRLECLGFLRERERLASSGT